jgi:hypothetical protein
MSRQATKVHLVLMLLLLVSLPLGKAAACSCNALEGTDTEQVRHAFAAAKFVFLGEITAVEKIPHSSRFGSESGSGERAKLKILRIWKGSKSTGDEFLIETPSLGVGACGVSVVNDPVWMEETDGAYAGPARFTGKWLIYADSEPYELSGCSRSHPYPFPRAVEDIGVLDAIAQHAE